MIKPEPVAFMSYAHFDDEHDRGQLTRFRQRLCGEVRAQTGDEFIIFQDRESIEWGQNWKDRIDKSINGVSFLIPVVTPSFFKSDPCRSELHQFIEREERLTRNDLILPLYYISSPVLEDNAKRVNDRLAETLASRQYADWRDLRFKSFNSVQARKSLEKLALQIRNTLEFIEFPGDVASSRESMRAPRSLRVFLSHSSVDKALVQDLYRRLRRYGIDPWLDEENLLPGQVWEYEITKAVQASDVIILCLSRSVLTSSGFIHKEIRFALDEATKQYRDTFFIIIVNLDESATPDRLSSYHFTNLYAESGFEKLLLALQERAKKLGLELPKSSA